MLSHCNSRPISNQGMAVWPRADKDYVHNGAGFQKTRGLRSFFIVHPDWISEAKSPPKAAGRTNLPWPWEFHGARDSYRVPVDYFRKRVGDDIQTEINHRSLSSRDSNYNVKIDTPLHVNNSKIVHDSNPLYNRPLHGRHTLPYNNQRQLLTRELSLPPIEDRLATGDLSSINSRCNTAAPPASAEPRMSLHDGPDPQQYMYREGSFNLSQRQPSYMSSRTSAPVFRPPTENANELRRMHSNYMTYDNWNN